VRRLLPGLLALAVVAGPAGLTGCGDRDGAAAPAPASSATSAAGDAEAAGVETAVREAEELLSAIDAELAADDTETG